MKYYDFAYYREISEFYSKFTDFELAVICDMEDEGLSPFDTKEVKQFFGVNDNEC